MEKGLQRKVALGFMAAMLMTASLDFLSWSNKKAASDEADLVAHTFIVTRHLDATLGDVVDVETGARGFAATGQEQLLDPFNSGQISLVQDLRSLRQLTTSDSAQDTWLDPLTNRIKMSVALSQEMVASRRRSPGPQAAEFQRGKSLVDAVRKSIRAQQSEQARLLNQRTESTQAKREQFSFVLIASALVELTLLALAWVAVSRALKASAKAREQIEILNSGLEYRVVKRTEELSVQTQLLARTAEALRAESRTLQAVLDNMQEGLVVADTWGRFTHWNHAAEEILGMTPKEGLAMERWTENFGLYLPNTQTPYPMDELPLVRAMNGQASDEEMFVRNPSRSEGVWLEVSARPLKHEDGAIHGGMATFRDISKRKGDEAEIRLLNEELERRVTQRTVQLEAANKELEAFTYSVSHDLRAPLRHLTGFSQILLEEFAPALAPEPRRYLERIAQAARKMGVLVDELLGLAGIGRHILTVQTAKLNPLVDEIVGILVGETTGRIVEWKVEDLGFVGCDSVLIGQVFQNLIANALKFSRPRATAIIEIGRVLHSEQPTFFVRDNGVGFDMKYADKLFGVFQRLHRIEDFEGTGIGLATVRRIVQKHAGRAWADSELGKGATFYFTIPAPVGFEVETKANSVAAGVQL